MKTRIVLLLATLALVACGDDLDTLRVNKSDIPLAINTTGELASSRTIELGAPVVKYTWHYKLSYLIPEGTWVQEGEKVMAFDPQQQVARLRDLQNRLATESQRLQSQTLDREQQMEELKLELAEAKMELEKAELKASNIDNLVARLEVEKLRIDHKIARKNYEMATYRNQNRAEQMTVERDIIRSEVERLNSEVAEATMAIQSMEVKAPRDGIVVYKPNNRDEKPAEGDQISLIQRVLELPDLNTMIVRTTIPEQNAYRISEGALVELQLDAVAGRTFKGRVQSLGQIVRVKSRQEPSKVFDAVVSIDNPDRDVMRPGMTARLSIIERIVSDGVAIPERAIIYRGEDAFVRVKRFWGESERAVTIGARQLGKAIVTEGLRNGEEVIL
ncbi:efflux RND transporter periplasmic adaptor subunit [Marinimicrobium sp. ABcell2]|uniref:efflux RND transporter periplasmic adaptor subunit n=1 Tax=Marinimicrobium sp. ABcell2 TaxID=3069751 RepID=UPI0027B2CF4D|nr:efflux RND transporter periplasmic adaptor subunit [Marinimicrobium sp. ABcell2]MDQ2076446.1 efflux RND transporter periplasmic adaptor subunit [Marinimicrobium sp. ABcell2]